DEDIAGVGGSGKECHLEQQLLRGDALLQAGQNQIIALVLDRNDRGFQPEVRIGINANELVVARLRPDGYGREQLAHLGPVARSLPPPALGVERIRSWRCRIGGRVGSELDGGQDRFSTHVERSFYVGGWVVLTRRSAVSRSAQTPM